MTSTELPEPHVRLEAQQLAKRYGSLVALRDVSFVVREGEVLGLLGPNGAGKTTLMACLAGLEFADAGRVLLDGAPLARASDPRTLFYLPDGMTPWRAQRADWLLDFGANAFGCAAIDLVALRRTLRIDELARQSIGTLSKGQRKRLLLAFALQMPSDVLLLDEPFDGLDLRLTRDVAALLRAQAAVGRSLVISMHDLHGASRVCDRLVLLDDGRVVADGTLTELRDRSGRVDAELDEVFLAFV